MSDSYSLYLDRPDAAGPTHSLTFPPADTLQKNLAGGMGQSPYASHLQDMHEPTIEAYPVGAPSDISASYSYQSTRNGTKLLLASLTPQLDLSSMGHNYESTTLSRFQENVLDSTLPYSRETLEKLQFPHDLGMNGFHALHQPVEVEKPPQDPRWIQGAMPTYNYVPQPEVASSIHGGQDEIASLMHMALSHFYNGPQINSAQGLRGGGGYPRDSFDTFTAYTPFDHFSSHSASLKSEEVTGISSERLLPYEEHFAGSAGRRLSKDRISHSGHQVAKTDARVSPKSAAAWAAAGPLALQKLASAPAYHTPHSSSMRPQVRIVRGMTTGGATTRPPKQAPAAGHEYAPAELVIHGTPVDQLCQIPWDDAEKTDRRRIIRIERTQSRSQIHIFFLIVGLAENHPEPAPPPPGVDVVEVSCLECYRSETDSDPEDDADISHYITSVEVVGIVEVLIGIRDMDSMLRRKERGRIRSNLMPFWMKKPVSSKKGSDHEGFDSRMEFARRIMAYDIRKPRGFDKDVRILEWLKLVPALQRAIQCYFVEVPMHE